MVIISAVFEARYSEMEWMINKNLKEDDKEEQESDFVSLLYNNKIAFLESKARLSMLRIAVRAPRRNRVKQHEISC
jgi:hypothetical protein